MNVEQQSNATRAESRDTVHDQHQEVAAHPSDEAALSDTVKLTASNAAWMRLVGLSAGIGETLASRGDTHELLHRCTDVVVQRFGAAFVRIWTLKHEERMLHLQASSGEYTRLDGRYSRIAVGRFRVGHIAQTAQPYLTNDLANDSRIDDREWVQRQGLVSFAGHPLFADGRVVGVLAMFAHRPLPPTTLDELAVIADGLAQFLERRRAERERAEALERELEARKRAGEAMRRTAFLARASLALDSCADFKSTLARVSELVVNSLADWCLVGIVEEKALVNRALSAADTRLQELLDGLQPAGGGGVAPSPLIARTLDTGEPLLFRDFPDLFLVLGEPPDENAQGVYEQLKIRDVITVPLQARNQVIGICVLVADGSERRFTEADLSLAVDFARRCGLALDHARLLEDAQQKISERKWAEEALLRSEENLRQAAKMEAVGRLAGGIAHDFNNILTAILGYAELLENVFPKTSPAGELVSQLQQVGERACGLTRRLLSFSRKQSSPPRAVNLNELLGTLGDMLRRLLRENLELVFELDPNLGSMQADPNQIEQVIINLVVNARDAMPDGGRLTLTTNNVAIDASWSHLDVQPGPYVLLAVQDRGCGISEEIRAHLFEPFFSTKRAGEGTGLGLAISYGIVHQAGGFIDVESQPGQGSTFKVYFPRSEAVATKERARTTATHPPRGSETVLLAEDDDVIRELVARALRGAGYTVIEAADGDAALRAASGYAGIIHLLITDMVMPRVCGPALAEQLLNRRPGMQLLFCSGHIDTQLIKQQSRDQPCEFLEKPFTPDTLLRKVRALLDRK